MAVTVTVDEVKEGFVTAIPEDEIQAMIDFIDECADTCLDANSVPANSVTLLKKYAVRHMCTLMVNNGRGTIKSEKAPSGAGRSFNSWVGEDVDATTYGAMLNQMDKFGCVVSAFQNSSVFDMFSIGCHPSE